MKILFRTDSSLEIGSGHVMRCLTLAKALLKRGAECQFVCRAHDGNLSPEISAAGFRVHLLPCVKRSSDANLNNNVRYEEWLGASQQEDAEATIGHICESTVDWIVIDHYGIDREWENALRPFTKKIFVIDDLASRNHDCDVLLDQNLVDNFESRYDTLVPDHCIRLLGPDFAILQPEYAQLHPRTPPRLGPALQVLVYFGGADVHNLTGMTMEALSDPAFAHLKVDVILNANNPHSETIHDLAIRHGSKFQIYQGLPSLAPLIVKADFAIGASGATSWERCCLGLPAIVVTLAENQVAIATELSRHDLVTWLGDQHEVSVALLRNTILNELKQGECLFRRSIKCLDIVDGKGASRVTERIMLNDQTRVVARQAVVADKPQVRKLTLSAQLRDENGRPVAKNPIAFETWFFQCLRNLDRRKLYLIVANENITIGYCLFACRSGVWDFDFHLDTPPPSSELIGKILNACLSQFQSDNFGTSTFAYQEASMTIPSESLKKLTETSETSPKQSVASINLAICSDTTSWLNRFIPTFIVNALNLGCIVTWTHDAESLDEGDLCFFLSYSKIVGEKIRAKFEHNLVVHESDLPAGRGWSPMSWQILEGKNRIPVTLIEAASSVDSGMIYSQQWLKFEGYELIDEIRALQAKATNELCIEFVKNFVVGSPMGRPQLGEPSYFARRTPECSRLDLNKNISEQFNLLRIVDNTKYPAFFEINGHRYNLHVTHHE